ncbi:MAG TPA: type II secretion system protein GspL [Gammaproteobacteria bacterium]|nr:type II secretion system protein GspL [Gammaproteobacteria bacterium]
MHSYFLVYPLSEDWQEVAWCSVAPDIALKMSKGSLETLAQVAQTTPIFAVLPGKWISIFSVELPKVRATAMLKKALPFLLEEQLAEDFETVHIALPTPFRAGEITPLAVISKAQMQTLVTSFKAQQLNLLQAFPNWMCLPLFEGTWTIYLDENYAHVRQEAGIGFSIQKDLLIPMLNLALTQSAAPPQSLHIYHSPLMAAELEEQFGTLAMPLAYEAVQDDALLFFARQLVLPVPLNLLQGEYFIKPKLSAIGRMWRNAAGLAAAVVLVQILQSSLHYQQTKQQYDEVHKKVLALYTQVFPGEENVANARTRLEQALGGAKVSDDNPLFVYLTQVTAPILNTEGVELKQLAFQNNAMRLEVMVKDFATLSQLEAALSAQGLTVKQDSASLEENQVIAQLNLSRGKS